MNLASLLRRNDWLSVWRDHADAVILAVVKIVAILIVYVAVRYLLFRLINRLLDIPAVVMGSDLLGARKARLRALQTLLKSVTGVLLGFIAVVMILAAVGFNIVPILSSVLATAGVVGLAIGFGAQKLVRDTISGFFILMDDQYGVGDYVTIGAASGVVEELGIRTTRVRDKSGKLFIISNGDIGQITNHSRGKLHINTDIKLPVTTDLDKAKRIIREVGESMVSDMPDKVKEPFDCTGLSVISGASITLRVTGSVAALYQDEVLLELNARLRDALDREGVQLA